MLCFPMPTLSEWSKQKEAVAPFNYRQRGKYTDEFLAPESKPTNDIELRERGKILECTIFGMSSFIHCLFVI